MAATFSQIKPRTIILSLMMVAAAGLAALATPKLHENTSLDMDARTPAAFGAWSAVANPMVQVSLSTTANDINQPYDQTVMRTYTDGRGRFMQVALAWGKHQRQEVKIHRPELCYPAQGLAVESIKDVTFPLPLPNHRTLVGKRMIANSGSGQKELVSYWIRIGSIYSGGALHTRLHILQEGLAGHTTDGILVRVSQRVSNDQDFDAAFAQQEQFLADLYRASPAELQYVMAH